jgi:hypothetical protein
MTLKGLTPKSSRTSLNDLGKEQVLADIQNWLDERIGSGLGVTDR